MKTTITVLAVLASMVMGSAAALAQAPAGYEQEPVLDAKDLGISRRRFEPGARTFWHSHDKGQLLFVEQGRARLQRKGEPMKEFGAGESDYTAPNVVHWHGTVPDRALVQIAVSFGGETKWLEQVTDAEYAGKR